MKVNFSWVSQEKDFRSLTERPRENVFLTRVGQLCGLTVGIRSAQAAAAAAAVWMGPDPGSVSPW